MTRPEVLRLPNGEALPLRNAVTSADEAGLKTGPHAGTTAQAKVPSPRALACASFSDHSFAHAAQVDRT